MAGLTVGERDSLVALAHCVEPGDVAVGRLLRDLGPAELLDRIRAGRIGLRHGPGLALRLAASAADRAADEAARLGARIVTRLDREWPTQLDALGDRAPLALWVLGAADLRLLALRSVAVVGARACSPYGAEVAHGWCAAMAAAGWTVVSGAAVGIDAAAHRGSLAGGGTTIAVLAGGVDVPYPRAHDALLARIVDDGLVVSESPLGEAVRRQRFLSRNRIIAALGRGTLVVEAAIRSGTAATAAAAAHMGRVVLAVPGPVDAPASAGCHRMIRDGTAILAAEVEDVLAALDLDHGAASSPARRRQEPGHEPDLAVAEPGAGDAAATQRATDALAPRERTVLDALPARGACRLEVVAARAGLAPSDTLAALVVLSAQGWVVEALEGWRLAQRA